MKLPRFVLAVFVPILILLASCSGIVSVPTTPTTGNPSTVTTTTPAPTINPFISLAVRIGADDACYQATKTGGSTSLLAKLSAAESLVSSGDVLSAVEAALLSGTSTDPRRAFYLSLIIQTIQTSGNVPKTAVLTLGSPSAQLVSTALAGCRGGILRNSLVKAEALGAPSPSLASYMYKAGYTDSIAKGSQWFDTSLPLSARIVHGHLDVSFPSGTNERVGLDQSKVKGVMVGFEGGSCDVIQWWIINTGPSFGVPVSYVCTSADLWDAMYSDGKRGANVWNDVYLSAYIAAHPVAVVPSTPDPVNPPAVNPICLSGGCFPDLCPTNCSTVPVTPPTPPVVPGCPVCSPVPLPTPPPVCVALPARVLDTLKQRRAGHAILNPGRLREVVDFFAAHAGSCWVP